MKKNTIKNISLLFIFLIMIQSCFSYKNIEYSQISNDKKQKFIVKKIDKKNVKGKLISINEKQIILKKNGKLKKIKKEEVFKVSVRKFSISKTVGGVVGGYGTIVFILPIIIVLAAFA